jgi:hypothetical protein
MYSPLPDKTQRSQKRDIYNRAGFEIPITASQRPQGPHLRLTDYIFLSKNVSYQLTRISV